MFTSVPVSVPVATDWVMPPVKPVPVGANQVYVVPAGTIPLLPFTGEVLNTTPPHATSDIGVMLARGLIVTVNWNDAPLPHAAVFGVTV